MTPLEFTSRVEKILSSSVAGMVCTEEEKSNRMDSLSTLPLGDLALSSRYLRCLIFGSVLLDGRGSCAFLTSFVEQQLPSH